MKGFLCRSLLMEYKDYPGLYQTSDKASLQAQTCYLRAIQFYLILLISGAVCTLFLGECVILAIIAAVILLATLSTSILLASKRFDKTWYSGRAVAESVKTITWRYMMHAEPYHDPDENITKSIFLNDLRQILEQNKQLEHIFTEETATMNAISSSMAKIRGLSLDDRKNLYLKDRIDDQRDWYCKKAKFNKRQASIWFVVMCAAQAFALILVLIRIAKPAWHYLPINILIICAGAALTWMQTNKFQDLSTAFSLTAHEICLLREDSANITNQTEFSHFVNNTESAFSREHTQWQARRQT